MVIAVVLGVFAMAVGIMVTGKDGSGDVWDADTHVASAVNFVRCPRIAEDDTAGSISGKPPDS